ncbi:hypothetical protein ACFL45_11535 [Candidatus Neomarinimicrobiota bacterium]
MKQGVLIIPRLSSNCPVRAEVESSAEVIEKERRPISSSRDVQTQRGKLATFRGLRQPHKQAAN